MRLRVSLVLTGLLVLGLACVGGKDANDDASGDDSSAATDDSLVTDDSTPGDDTSYGQTFDMEDPAFVVSLDGAEWKTGAGYYFSGTSSHFKGELTGEPSYYLEFDVDGEARFAGTYTVTQISYSQNVSASPTLISKDLAPSMTFTVLGFADGTYVFGTLEGTATLSGDNGEHTIDGGELRAWPKY